jgi:YggT family protein
MMPAAGADHFIITAAKIIDIVLNVYIWIIIARAITSWIPVSPYNRVIVFPHRGNIKQKMKQMLSVLYGRLVIFLYRVTEPVFRPVRRIIPRHSLPIDLAPLAVLLMIMIIQYLLFQVVIFLMHGL